MLAKLDPEASLDKLKHHRPDIKNLVDLDEELENFSTFIKNPNKESFVSVATSIRKDLWGKSSSLSNEVSKILESI